MIPAPKPSEIQHIRIPAMRASIDAKRWIAEHPPADDLAEQVRHYALEAVRQMDPAVISARRDRA